MDQETNVILREMDVTRDALADKISLLEGQVKDSVENAKSTVEETISQVKESVKNTFSIQRRIEKNPLGALGIAIGAGIIIGNAFFQSDGRRATVRDVKRVEPKTKTTAGTESAHSSFNVKEVLDGEFAQHARDFALRFEAFFHEEIQMAKGMIFAAAVEKIREKALVQFPQAKDQINELVTHIENKLRSKTTA
jgi:ElaB/YqjD/DUF883 family membrane-anchored ribosome-binding protein